MRTACSKDCRPEANLRARADSLDKRKISEDEAKKDNEEIRAMIRRRLPEILEKVGKIQTIETLINEEI